MEWIWLIAGFLLLGFTLTDFFFTTLSCNGAGGMSTLVNRTTAKLYKSRGSSTRLWAGAIHLIVTLFTWVILLLLAGVMIYVSFEDMVLNSSSKEPADLARRIYFTGFVFSTLGTGDYVPGSNFSRYFSVAYSILGFGVLTTAITYIINVMNSANDKKNLASYISSMGDTPLELFDYFTTTPDAKLFTNRIDDLVELLNTHITNHLCYPIVHYFLSDMRGMSAAVQLASLHEATAAMRIRYQDDDEVMAHLNRVDRTMHRFLDIARIDIERVGDMQGLAGERRKWSSRVPDMVEPPSGGFSENKQLIGSLLLQFGRDWREVYGE
jgi:hypothetical protein